MSQIRDKKAHRKHIATMNPINAKSVQPIELHAFLLIVYYLYPYRNHLTSSKITQLDYQYFTSTLVQIGYRLK